MSTLIVDVNRISEIKTHSNADALELVEIKGWQVVTRKGSFKEGDFVVYFPPDSVITEELGNKLGVYKYTSKGKVKGIKLRGEPSFGFCIPIEELKRLNLISDLLYPVGCDLAKELNVTKYEPPVNLEVGDAERDHPLFHKHIDIENFGNYSNLINDNEEVVLTEKIHGTNSRIGIVDTEDGGDILVAGSHNLRKKVPTREDGTPFTLLSNIEEACEIMSKSLYWYPLSILNIQKMLLEIKKRYNAKSVILFGEVYGWVQSLRYGHEKGKVSFAAFDLSVNGKYLDFSEFFGIMTEFKIPVVPILHVEYFRNVKSKLNDFASENTMIKNANHIREGLVIRLSKERYDPKVGRVILKYKNVDYLAGNYE